MTELEKIKEFALSKGYDTVKYKCTYKGHNVYLLKKSKWTKNMKIGFGYYVSLIRNKIKKLEHDEVIYLRMNDILFS